MNRAERLTMADAANNRAAALAREAERAARGDARNTAAALAAAGGLWADIARSHAAIALAITDTEEK